MAIDTTIGEGIRKSGKTRFIDFQLYTSNLSELPNHNRVVINTINAHSFCIAEKDKVFKDSLINCDVLLPDGAGIVMAYKFLYKRTINKISGMELFMFLLERYKHSENRETKKIFFLGSSEATLALIKKKMQNLYPCYEIYTFSPPFKDALNEKETEEIIESIASFNPHILFVGMTAPKQEKWVYANKDYLSANYICSIGAVFDFFAGTIKRPGEFWIENSLEWLARFAREPKRLWRRVLLSTPIFLFKIVKYKLFRGSDLR